MRQGNPHRSLIRQWFRVDDSYTVKAIDHPLWMAAKKTAVLRRGARRQSVIGSGGRVPVAVSVRRPASVGELRPFNVFNENAVLTENLTWGSVWRQPLSIMGGRLMKFSINVDF